MTKKYQLFVIWCLLYILDHLDLKKDIVFGGMDLILIEIYKLFHFYTCKSGWTNVVMDTM